MKLLNLTTCPLTGTNLIEASAGTGKTYTISYLYLRLLLERRIPVESILVVTFTEAATEELRSRIRNLIHSLLTMPIDPQNCDEITSYLLSLAPPEQITNLLESALRSFDQAAIFTIHGFCQRILQEHAFETGVRFDTELHTDSQGLVLAAAQDFWRDTFYGASPILIQYMLKNSYSVDTFVNIARSLVGQPHISFMPETTEVDSEASEQSFMQAFNKAKESWQQDKESIQSILLSWPHLVRRKYQTRTLHNLFQITDRFFTRTTADPDLFDGFERLTSSMIRQECKGANAPAHDFFDLAQQLQDTSRQLCEEFDRRLLALQIKAIPYIRTRLRLEKQRKNIHTFDDLLILMLEALNSSRKQQVIETVRNRYSAALIDEFQDTDSIQYAIFNALFEGKKRTLYLIGDPKQAIYSFRGADIFTYMQAARAADQRFTLGTNYRSDPRLITAVNTVFSGIEAPFIYERDIPFQPVSSPDRTYETPLVIDNEENVPFHVWYFSSDRFSYRGRAIGKTNAKPLIVSCVSAEIGRLLILAQQGKARLGTRELRPGDIAVLVGTKDEARQVKQALAESNIPAVLQSAGNVFDTDEAHDLLRLLSAIAAPYDERKVRTALTTSLIGYDGERMIRCMESEHEYEKILERFRHFHELWRRFSFMSMITHCLHIYGIRKRLLSFSDGERRITNLLQLIELLQQTCVHQHMNMPQLIQWLATQCDPSSPRLLEHELRLESDDDAVQLVTIHSSKGLEYPIVFCPFLWRSSFVDSTMVLFHDDNLQQCCDMGSDNFARNSARAKQEQLAENIRLFYVALTRARCRCYMVWGRFNQADSAAPAYVFHHNGVSGESFDFVAQLEKHVASLSDQQRLADIHKRAQDSHGTITVTEIREKPPVPKLAPTSSSMEFLFCRRMSRMDVPSHGLSSFTSLTRHKPADEQSADYDEDTLSLPFLSTARNEVAPPVHTLSMFTFPRGAQAGTFFHSLLENTDFTNNDDEIDDELIGHKLNQFGYDNQWFPVIKQFLNTIRSVELTADTQSFSLSMLTSDNRLNELEFYYPIQSISPQSLSSILNRFTGSGVIDSIPEAIGRLDFSPAGGHMHGFIDLVFTCDDKYYLLDWKSNFLGYDFEDYRPDALARAMTEEYYFLQYYLYTLALDRYLALRLPDYRYEKDFGGVLYLFLRGLSPQQGMESGIFFDKPPAGLIESLRQELLS